MTDQTAPWRRRRLLVVAAATTAAVAASAALASGVAGVLLDEQVGDAVACRLPAGVEVTDVDLHGNPALAIAGGRLDGATVIAEGFPFGEASLQATVELDGVDLRSADTDAATLSVAVDAAALGVLVSSRPGPVEPPPVDLAIADGLLSLSATASAIPASITLTPSVHDDALRLTPHTVRIGSRTFAPDLIADRLPRLPDTGVHRPGRSGRSGGSGDPLDPRDLTVPGLSDGAHLVSAEVEGDRLVVTASLPEPTSTSTSTSDSCS